MPHENQPAVQQPGFHLANLMNHNKPIGMLLMAAGAVAMIVCGMFGFFQSYPEHYRGLAPLDAGLSLFYSALQLFFLETFIEPGDRVEPLLNIARFGAPLLLAVTAIGTVALLLEKEIREWQLARLRGHVVICGLGRKGCELARQFMPTRKVVIIERDENGDSVGTCRDGGAHVLIGDAADPHLLRKARATHAREVYLLTGSDGANFSAMMGLSRLKDESGAATVHPKVWLHVNALEMCSFLRDGNVLRPVRKNLDFEVVSLFEVAARELVVDQLVTFMPARPGDPRRFHLILVGFGRMGRTLVRKLVQTAVTVDGRRPLITVFSLDADADLKRMVGEVPGIHACCDLEIRQGDILLGCTRNELVEVVKATRDAGHVAAICLAADSQYVNLSAAIRLAADFGANHLAGVPLFVRQIESEGWSALADDLSGQKEGVYRAIRSFGLLVDLCRPESLQQVRLDAMARSLHEAYLAASQPLNPAKASHKPWEKLDWAFRQSSRNAADHIRVKLRTLGLEWAVAPSGTPVAFNPSPEDRMLLSKLEHCRWVVEKELYNWSAGDQTDCDRKIHTCLVDWDKLSDIEKQKDMDQVLALAGAMRAGGYGLIEEGAEMP
jgi:voltage-gated potassium channel Kch